MNAIAILSEILYWHRPRESCGDGDSGEIVLEKRFSGDMLQLSYGQLKKKLHLSKAQCRRSMQNLERLGVIKRHLRDIETDAGDKLNNVMFDKDTDECVCVIDLDTVMPNFVFSDIGDFLRTAANTAEEDEPDLQKIGFNTEIYEAFTHGYLESASTFLTPLEKDLLPYAVALFPYMQCVRFLADYLNGDTYYKIRYPEHNLVRTRAQFRLLQCVEEKLLICRIDHP